MENESFLFGKYKEKDELGEMIAKLKMPFLERFSGGGEEFVCYLCGNLAGDDDFMVTDNGECVCETCTSGLVDEVLERERLNDEF